MNESKVANRDILVDKIINHDIFFLSVSPRKQHQQGYQPQLLHNLVSDLINVFQLMECPVCMEVCSSLTLLNLFKNDVKRNFSLTKTFRSLTFFTLSSFVFKPLFQFISQTPKTPSPFTYQCVNGHIICQKCRPKTLRCPMCRVQLGRGRCLLADKVLRYLHNNSSVKIGLICDSEKTLSKVEINEDECQRSMENVENVSTENEASPGNLRVKRSTFLPFKLKFKTMIFWKNSWNKWITIFSLEYQRSRSPPKFKPLSGSKDFFTTRCLLSLVRKQKHKRRESVIAHECRSVADIRWELKVWL